MPTIGFSYQWALLYKVDFKKKRFSVGPVVLGRLLVVLGLESFWPLIYVFVCYPFASVFGSIKIVIMGKKNKSSLFAMSRLDDYVF